MFARPSQSDLIDGLATLHRLPGTTTRAKYNEVNLLASLKGSDARATLRAAIGDAEDDGRGFSVSLNFVHKGNGKQRPGRRLSPVFLVIHQEGLY